VNARFDIEQVGSPLRNEASDDLGQYPVEVLNRAADIFRMAVDVH
jgi:hypothetical protein